jgi:hypothetical protein
MDAANTASACVAVKYQRKAPDGSAWARYASNAGGSRKEGATSRPVMVAT